MSKLSTTKQPFDKPFLSNDILISNLENKGVHIPNYDFADIVLTRCNYYRLSAYLKPLINDDRFTTLECFDSAYELYSFDRHLRMYVFGLISNIEVGIRSSLNHWICSKTNNRFWYLDPTLFNENAAYHKTIEELATAFKRSKLSFAQDYKKKYYNEFSPDYDFMPPAWMICEVMSFGQLVTLINNFNPECIKQCKLVQYAKSVGLPNFGTLQNWLLIIKEIRNHCAHHNRIFNRNLRTPARIRRKLQYYYCNNRLYSALAALQVMLSGLKFTEKIGLSLAIIFDTYPVANCFLDSMGFPKDWLNEPLFFDLT